MQVDLLVLSAGIMHPDSLDKLQLDSVRQQVSCQPTLLCTSSKANAAMMPMPGQPPGQS